ncbi:DNA recombination protein RmuC [Mycetocola tolaasinivorans]|uniref:DNA recombination protein RmuC n=1 Tax=Mycetocola tolaasinivorans TaxID=76635 RepID=A0A3L7A7S9_9MICO|nr:DNA recombination protein RmuC [Mycetocola tolaasinivorans]RLP76389.1 DNA recombination protein RmuC [Mycetocola tolaasinivorans]
MDSLLPLLLGLALGLLLGAVLGGLVAQRRAASALRSADQRASAARTEVDILNARHSADLLAQSANESEIRGALRAELAALEATTGELRDQLEAQRRQAADQERRRAEEAAQLRSRESQDARVLEALAPVAETLRTMQTAVSAIENQRSLQHGELSAQLRAATEAEERLRRTTDTLAGALRSNNVRGVWGETQLRNVVEAAGLIERVDFSVQSSVTTDAGAGRPDMVVHLPGGKNIAVDAKVPFNAYLEASAIPATATGAEAARRESLLRDHVKAVREHVVALGNKTYWEGLPASPELVIAFIPSESLVSSALEADRTLLDFAFSKRVALASPVTLWSVLKTVAFSWQQDVLTKEATELFDLSRELHSRLAGTATRLQKLGRSIERSVKDYNVVIGSLEHQVLPSARKLGRIDKDRVIAGLTPVEEPLREITDVDLVAGLDRAASLDHTASNEADHTHD